MVSYDMLDGIPAPPSSLATMAPSDRQAIQAVSEDDHALMRRIATGDAHAFRDLVERHQKAVVGTAAKMLGGYDDAEDIGQQVFLRVWKNAKRYRPDARFTTYLFTITRNLVFNETRRRGRKKEVSADEIEESTGHLAEERAELQPDAQLLQDELRQAVDRAIASLPEAQRMAVVLRRYEQLPYEEIAKVLDLSVSAVKSLLFRARTALRESLSDYLADNE